MDVPKILLVDDSAVFRQLLLKQLDEFGSRVTQAENGRQGLERALSKPFDLIISDVEMPRMNGFKFCKEIKNNPAKNKILN